eukprot:15373667-Heterocapsa_arctica.AAC.1
MEEPSMVMLDVLSEKKRGVIDSFESPDGKLAAEFAEDVPSTMLKQRRWGASQGSSSGNSNDAMTGGLYPNIVPSVVTGTTGNGNPASVAVSRSSASSEANHT